MRMPHLSRRTFTLSVSALLLMPLNHALAQSAQPDAVWGNGPNRFSLATGSPGELGLLESQVASDLVSLAIDIAREVLRRELATDPESLRPVIREALVEVLVRRYPAGQRPWLRISRPLASAGDLKAWVIGAMGAKALQALAQQAGLPHTPWLTGIYGFDGDAARYAGDLAFPRFGGSE